MCSLCLKSLCMMRISIITFVSCVFITVFCSPTKHLRIFFNFKCPTKHLLISCNHPSCELHSLCVNLNLQIDLNGINQCICAVSSWLIQLLTFYCQFLTCYVSIATKEPLVILMIPNDRLTGPVWRDIFSEGQIKTDIVSEAVTRCILPSLSLLVLFLTVTLFSHSSSPLLPALSPPLSFTFIGCFLKWCYTE